METEINPPSRGLSFPKNSNSTLHGYGKLGSAAANRDFQSESYNDNNAGGNARPRTSRCFFTVLCGTVAVSGLIALCIVLAIHARQHNGSSDGDSGPRHGGGGNDLSTGSAAIQAACNQTMYPDLCFEWLSSQPDALSADPLQLASIAIRLATSFVQQSSSALLSAAADPSVNTSSPGNSSMLMWQSIQDCIELMNLSDDQLNSSSSDLSSLSLRSLKSGLSNIKARLSGTMGFQLACSEGLGELLDNLTATTDASASTSNSTSRGRILVLADSQEKVSKGVSIVLGIIDALSSLGEDLSSWKKLVAEKLHFRRRRLLEFDPSISRQFGSSGDHHIRESSPILMQADVDQIDRTLITTLKNLDNSADGFPDWFTESDRRRLQSAAAVSVASADIVVAQDGSGKYRTIKDALNNVPSKRTKTFVIYIKKGVYKEYVNIPKSMKNLMLVGDGIGKTIITGSKSFTGGSTTYNSATVAVSPPNFLARGITFQNTAGAKGHQAVALRVSSDYAVFDSCSFDGYQDTLYALASRQFYTGCTILGTVDFIFGNAIAVFQKCSVLGRQPMPNQKNTYTAQGRKVPGDPSGFSFHLCTVAANSDLLSSSYKVKSYFGRPWKAYSRTVWMQCAISNAIDPAGWLPWDATNPYTDTLYYGEYANTGAGASTGGRVAWKGVHPAMSKAEANGFTVQNFIGGSSWLPATQVSFQASLS